VLGSLLVLVQLNWSSPSWTWTLEGHRLIALDPLAVLPPPMREALTPHVSAILAGVVEPDFYRIVSHKIPIFLYAGRHHRSGAARPTRSSSSPQTLKRCFVLDAAERSCFLYRVKRPTLCRISTSHCMPLGARPVPAQMLYRSWQKDHTYRGFMLVENYSCFAFEIAQNSSQHARSLFFDREIKRVTEIAWDQAVNDTANLWQSIFWHALGPERVGHFTGSPSAGYERIPRCRRCASWPKGREGSTTSKSR